MRILVVLASLAMPIIAWLNQRGLFGPDNGTISDRYPTLLIAAGYAFAIWGLIFALDVLLAASQAWKSGPRRDRHVVSDRARVALFIGFALTASWMIVFSAQVFWLALLVIWAALASLLYALFQVQQQSRALMPGETVRPGTLLARGALGLHAGWLSLAAFLNTAQVIVAYGLLPGNSMPVWSTVLWCVAGALLLIVNWRLRANVCYVLAAIWGLIGVLIEQSHGSLPGANGSAMIAGCLATALSVQTALILAHRRGHAPMPKPQPEMRPAMEPARPMRL